MLLEWPITARNGRRPGRLEVALTHEEIAQIIGTSRETVTRLFADFKKKQLIQRNGSTLIIRNRPVLETMIAA